jgi:pilus assembly protein Flp/PilA
MDLLSLLQPAIGRLAARVTRSQRGASLVEYALLVALIAVVCLVAVTVLGQNANTKLSSVGSSLQ